MDAWDDGPFLISAAPGAGKTRPALEFARRAAEGGPIGRVARRLPDDAADAPVGRGGRRARACTSRPTPPSCAPPRDFHGVAVTYARVAASAARWARAVHAGHARHRRRGPPPRRRARVGRGLPRWPSAATQRWLLLSGTPFRSDQCPIPGVRYDDGVAVPDVVLQLRRRRARRHLPAGHVHPLRRHAVVAVSGDDVIEASLRRRAHRRARPAAATAPRSRPSSPTGCRGSSRAGRTRACEEVRAGGPPRRRRARRRRRRRARARGREGAAARSPGSRADGRPAHRRARGARSCRRSRASATRWIVAVNMVSEGVDIPRLRVGVYATAAKTPLIFRQIVGRFVRTIAGPPAGHELALPARRPVLRVHAARRRGASCATSCARRRRAATRPSSTSCPSARETEKTDARPVRPARRRRRAAARAVRRRPAGAARRRRIVAVVRPGASPEPDRAAEMPAFERRALLRDKRHRLVADLAASRAARTPRSTRG